MTDLNANSILVLCLSLRPNYIDYIITAYQKNTHV